MKAQKTQVISGEERITQMMKVLSRTREKFCLYCDEDVPMVSIRPETHGESYRELRARGVKIQCITRITEENLNCCKQLISEYGFDLRHIDETLKGFLCVGDVREYIASPELSPGKPASIVLYSNSRHLAQQQQHLFDSQWKRAIPADLKIGQLEGRETPVETKLLTDSEITSEAILALIEHSGLAYQGKPGKNGSNDYLYLMGDKTAPLRIVLFLDQFKRIIESNPDAPLRIILDIQNENLDQIRAMVKLGLEIRHLEGNNILLLVSRTEQIKLLSSGGATQKISSEALITTHPDQIMEATRTFRSLWRGATPVKARMTQLEKGLELGETRTITDSRESSKLGSTLLGEVKNEILMVLPPLRATSAANPGYRDLVSRSRANGIKIRVLVCAPSRKEEEWLLKGVEWHEVKKVDAGVTIYDRSKMIITPNSESSLGDQVYVSTIYTTNKSTIAGMVSIFEALWRESEVREGEERRRKQAELLRDILSHDLRNRTQIALMGAELLNGRIDLATTKKVSESILDALRSSMELVENANKLGRATMKQEVPTATVDVLEVLARTSELAAQAIPTKEVTHSFSTAPLEGKSATPKVWADDLLDEIFLNIYTNAIKYTPGKEVPIETKVKKVVTRDIAYWQISITDHGKGIPDDSKTKIFARYLTGAHGSGLGLSIVYALAVDRYKGGVRIGDRVAGDYTKGTVVVVWLPMG